MKKYTILILSLILLLTGCGSDSKTDIEPPLQESRQGYITLSFDDVTINSWYFNRDIFINHDIKVTFFISNYGRDVFHSHNPAVPDRLFGLALDGHEIAFHSVSHKNAQTLFSEGMTWKEYYEIELEPDLTLMQEAGCEDSIPAWCPTTFAYPFGADVHEYTEGMREMNLFKGLRDFTTSSEIEITDSFSYLEMGYSIDSHRIDFDELARTFNELQLNGGIVVLATHEIVDGEASSQYSITRENLIRLISLAQGHGLEFLTFSEAVDMFMD